MYELHRDYETKWNVKYIGSRLRESLAKKSDEDIDNIFKPWIRGNSMVKILFVSDVHLGIRYPYHIDLRTGISQRTMDFVTGLKRVDVDKKIK